MEYESWGSTHECDDILQLPPLPGECVDNKIATSVTPPPPNTPPAWDLPQACPPNTRADLFLSQSDPSLTQSGPFIINAGPCHTQAGSSDSQLEFTFDDDFYPRELDRYIDLTLPFSDVEFSFDEDLFSELDSPIDVTTPLSEVGPSDARQYQECSPSFTQSRTSPTQTGTSQTQAGSNQTCRRPSQTKEILKASFDEDLFSDIDSPIDVTTALSDAGPSDAQPDQECSPSFTQSRTSPTQTGTSQIQAGPNQTQRRPFFHTQEMFQTEFNTYKCIACEKVYAKKGNLTRHVYEEHANEHSSNFFECNLCKKCFVWNDNLLRHIKNKHSDRKPEYECSKCGRTFTTRFSLTRHSQRFCRPLGERCLPTADEPATTNEGFSQNQTGPSLMLESSSTQRDHCYSKAVPSQAQIKMQPTTAECIFCKKGFTSIGNLNRHIKTKHEKNPICFTCDHCGKDFLRNDILQEHLNTQHSKRNPDYKCSELDKWFSTSHYGIRNRNVTCPSLKKRRAFAGDDSAVVDEDVDTPELGPLTHIVEPGTGTGRSEQPSNPDKGCELYECPNCGRKYTFKKNLMAHLRHRCGVLPQFSCLLCSYKTHYKNHIKYHIVKKHGSELPQ